MATTMAVLGFWEVRTNLIQIKNISKYVCDVVVFRDDHETTVRSSELVPGNYVTANNGK
jgi:magnesium-transporting ATPase (P-type)